MTSGTPGGGAGTYAAINAEYGTGPLMAMLQRALAAGEQDPAALDRETLARADQLHHGGIGATRALAQMAGVAQGCRVVDLGGGVGGPARLLAREYGATVDVVDLTEEFCRLGAMLTERVGLADRVRFYCTSALTTGLPDGGYELVWIQNSAMNIPDRPGLYAEARRLLPPGGRLALQEITAGNGEPVAYPMPWATTADRSFLLTPDQVRSHLSGAGFRLLDWYDETAEALQQFEAAARAEHEAAGPAGRVSPLRENLITNTRAGRVTYHRAVFEAV